MKTKTSMGLAILSIICMVTVPHAKAQTTNQPLATTQSQLNEVSGATTGLGSSHRFADAADAANHCPGDTVVWSIGPHLTYYLPGSPAYGLGAGFYACKAEADDAGFLASGS